MPDLASVRNKLIPMITEKTEKRNAKIIDFLIVGEREATVEQC